MPVRIPAYLTRFTCIGPACPYSLRRSLRWGRPLFEEYALFVARSVMIRLHLIAAAFGGSLDHETVIDVVQAFEKSVARTAWHDNAVLDRLRTDACINVEQLAYLVLDSAQ